MPHVALKASSLGVPLSGVNPALWTQPLSQKTQGHSPFTRLAELHYVPIHRIVGQQVETANVSTKTCRPLSTGR